MHSWETEGWWWLIVNTSQHSWAQSHKTPCLKLHLGCAVFDPDSDLYREKKISINSHINVIEYHQVEKKKTYLIDIDLVICKYEVRILWSLYLWYLYHFSNASNHSISCIYYLQQHLRNCYVFMWRVNDLFPRRKTSDTKLTEWKPNWWSGSKLTLAYLLWHVKLPYLFVRIDWFIVWCLNFGFTTHFAPESPFNYHMHKQ